MEWLKIIKECLPINLNIGVQHKKIVKYTKLDMYDLEVCKPKLIRRERSFFRKDQLDKFHLYPDGSVSHEAYE